MMARFVFDADQGRMVNKETGEPMVTGKAVALPRMIRPMNEYQSPITGEMITDRRQEREHMAKHGVVHTAEIKQPRKLKNERFIKKHGLQHLSE
jgi:hypothetical protein